MNAVVTAPLEGEVIDADMKLIGSALAEYSRVDAGLANLRERYKDVTYDVITREGMTAATAARRELRDVRLKVEAVRKDAKAPLLALGKRLDGEAKRITAEVSALEDPIDAGIKAEEKRREDERRAKEDLERARIAEIHKRMAAIEAMPERFSESPAARLAEVIAQLEAGLKFDYAEFSEHAEAMRLKALEALRALHASAVGREASAAAEAAERERQEAEARATREAEDRRLAEVRAAEEQRLAAERADLERLRQEQAKRDQEERARRDEEDRQRRERIAAEEKQLADLRAAQEAERLRVEGIRERIDELRGCPNLTAQSSAALIAEHLSDLGSIAVDDSFAEFIAEARSTKVAGLARLGELLSAANAREVAEARAQAEREELDRQRREIEDARARAEAEAVAKAQREQAEREATEREAAEEQARRDARAAMASRQRPDASEMADAVAEAFAVDSDIAAGWIAEVPHGDWAALALNAESAITDADIPY